MFKINKLILILLIIITFNIFFKTEVNSTPATFNLLILNSYNSENDWEKLILEGLKNTLSPYPNIDYKIEYLDIKSANDEKYLNGFLELLNIKYSNTPINAILTIDDEAFEFIRTNIFNSKAFCYKTSTIFVGVNKSILLSNEESNYIKGVVDIEDDLKFLNLIIDLNTTTNNIDILIDNATFSNVVKSDIEKIKKFTKKPLNINFIQSDYIEDILARISTNDLNNTAIIIVGDYKYKSTQKSISLKETLDLIVAKTTSPIFSKVQPYIYEGAIGGIVDYGQYQGTAAGTIITQLLNGVSINSIPDFYNNLDLTLFNYKSLNQFNINPLLLPKETVFINKKFYNLLLPKALIILVWFSILVIFISIIYLIISYFKNKKNALLKQIMLDKAIESEKYKTEFITTVSHELRTPLNIILNTSALLKLKINNNFFDDKYFLEKLNFIINNSNRLLRLVNNIIDISKIESGYIEPFLSLENIIEVIEETVLSVVDLAKARNITLIFDTDTEELYTTIDKSKIERCILNLLSNSIKFTNDGGNIFVNIKSTSTKIIIIISDNGIGIPKSQLDNIFKKFHQVDSSLTRAKEGSGLGLYIVESLIKLHGGSITVESTVNIGTTFTITLPIRKNIFADKNPNLGEDDLDKLVKLEMSDL